MCQLNSVRNQFTWSRQDFCAPSPVAVTVDAVNGTTRMAGAVGGWALQPARSSATSKYWLRRAVASGTRTCRMRGSKTTFGSRWEWLAPRLLMYVAAVAIMLATAFIFQRARPVRADRDSLKVDCPDPIPEGDFAQMVIRRAGHRVVWAMIFTHEAHTRPERAISSNITGSNSSRSQGIESCGSRSKPRKTQGPNMTSSSRLGSSMTASGTNA